MTTKSRPTSASILKDVVAYVDVWSSSKTENYSKPFIQQLQDMGGVVSKTFNKQVTHVVFKNGHQATWNKAKKNGVRLVSVLWVARCKDDGEHIDEELYPALNDEVNSALKKRVHRCMQPRDTPERTPENDRRMKKKLDKMIEDLVPKSPFTDVSPYVIDEEKGIVYSPSMKRCDFMAQRLKEMREARENLSPAASQMGQSRLSPEFKPSLGNTPSHSFLQNLDEESDQDLNAYFGSNKTDGEEQHEATSEPQHTKDFQKPLKSTCSDLPRQNTLVQSPLPNSPAKESKQDKNPKRTSIKRNVIKKHISLESPCLDDCPEGSKSVQSVFTFNSFVMGKSGLSSSRSNMDKVTPPVRKSRTPRSLPESKPTANLEISSRRSSTFLPEKPNVLHTSLKITTPKSKGSECRKSSLPALERSCTVSNGFRASCVDDDDGVFVDFFSPANNPRRQRSCLLPSLPLESKVQIPFELEPQPSPGKRKRGKSETTGSESASAKKRTHGVPSVRETSSVNSMLDQHAHPHQDTKGCPSSEDNNTKQTLTRSSRRSALPFSRVSKDFTDELTSAPDQQSASTDLSKPSLAAANKALGEQKSLILLTRHKDKQVKSSRHFKSM
ncbi:microcephalin isoform X2 [Salmo salar]|uniref:Microcephalin isoform X2 n=1 Tax=Salmo salar TaxID=8030 RepID=A0A1S3Q6Q9_SALSA|nr:microcephalin-like isoform X2 [Salmo salar]|eukprot:XP_014035663.1 PREDICTED: microcephalin-like isoform X2 [Salmo salar]